MSDEPTVSELFDSAIEATAAGVQVGSFLLAAMAVVSGVLIPLHAYTEIPVAVLVTGYALYALLTLALYLIWRADDERRRLFSDVNDRLNPDLRRGPNLVGLLDNVTPAPVQVAPLLAAVGVSLAIGVVTPLVPVGYASQQQDFFSTAGEVIAGLLIAIALESRRTPAPLAGAELAVQRCGLGLVLLSVIGALVGILNGLPSWVYMTCLTYVAAGLAGAFVAVFVLSPRLAVASSRREPEPPSSDSSPDA